MPDTLAVHVNRGELHGLEVPNSFEVTGSFVVEITNHGEPLHVHLHLDDTLSEVAALEANNHHVDAERARRVQIAVDPREEVRGRLKIVTAYGATTRYIDLLVDQPEAEKNPVQVDESLNKPKPKAERRSPGPTRTNDRGTPIGSGDLLADRPEAAVLGLGAVALIVAVVAALVLQNVVVVMGSLIVVAGVLVAGALLLR